MQILFPLRGTQCHITRWKKISIRAIDIYAEKRKNFRLLGLGMGGVSLSDFHFSGLGLTANRAPTMDNAESDSSNM
ncbi:hypothetical protein SESBI_03208 [Sesbania bispinosa]|nr:hypothetical protein SESBI_03208 [Sesbania bispinosa]